MPPTVVREASTQLYAMSSNFYKGPHGEHEPTSTLVARRFVRAPVAGLGLLRHERRAIAVSAVASFSPSGQRPIRATGRSLLRVR